MEQYVEGLVSRLILSFSFLLPPVPFWQLLILPTLSCVWQSPPMSSRGPLVIMPPHRLSLSPVALRVER